MPRGRFLRLFPKIPGSYELVGQSIRKMSEESKHPLLGILCTAKSGEQPCSGHSPISLRRLWRDLQNLGGLFNAQTAEVAKFHDTTLTSVNCRQRLEGLVES